jgi:hypothetical protein
MSTEAEVTAQATDSYANVGTSATVSFTYNARARLMRSVMQMDSARRLRDFDLDLDQQGVAVLPGGALVPAPSGPHQQGTPSRELLGSKQGPPSVPGQGRRDDPQAVSGRLAWGERLANPTPQSIAHLLKRGRTV